MDKSNKIIPAQIGTIILKTLGSTLPRTGNQHPLHNLKTAEDHAATYNDKPHRD